MGQSASMTPATRLAAVPKKGSRLWLWVIAAFAVQIAAWTAWFIFAAHHKIEEVPLATGTARGGGD